MKLGIKTYENYQTINLCGENGIHNDATANKCDCKKNINNLNVIYLFK